jgi:hypothetical protein
MAYFTGGLTPVLSDTTIFQLFPDFFQTFRNLIIKKMGFFSAVSLSTSVYAGRYFADFRQIFC